jgi:cephalosporin hydroxylase
MKRIITWILCFHVHYAHAQESVEELKQKVESILPNLLGWCSKEKAFHFMDLVLETKPDVYVEIGVFGGSSVFPVASTLKFLGKGIIIAIDPWDKAEFIKYFDPIEDRDHITWWSKVDMDQVYFSYLNMLSRNKLTDYVVTMKTTSEKAAQVMRPIDILYIDGNHKEEVSSKDVMLYLPKVKPGGYIWMDDCLWLDTQKAVNMLFDNCDVIKSIDNGNCILFRKR